MLRLQMHRTVPFALLAFLAGCSSSNANSDVTKEPDAGTGVTDGAIGPDGYVPPGGDSGGSSEGGVTEGGPPGFDAGSQDGGHVLADFPSGSSGEEWARVAAIASAPLDAIPAGPNAGSTGPAQWAALSRDGAYIVTTTDNGNLVIMDSDGSNGQVISIGGQQVSSNGRAAVAAGGKLIVYPTNSDLSGNKTPHATDLYAITNSASGWSTPVLLTGDMTTLAAADTFAHDVSISYDGTSVVFDCGISSDQEGPQDTCTAKTDGSGMSILVSHSFGPGANDTSYTHMPDYAPDGTVVFEADWSSGNEQIWRYTPSTNAVAVIGNFDDDNSPCVLPDGRVASLWLNAPGDSNSDHWLKVMSPDGSSYVIVEQVDTDDIGQSCGL